MSEEQAVQELFHRTAMPLSSHVLERMVDQAAEIPGQTRKNPSPGRLSFGVFRLAPVALAALAILWLISRDGPGSDPESPRGDRNAASDPGRGADSPDVISVAAVSRYEVPTRQGGPAVVPEPGSGGTAGLPAGAPVAESGSGFPADLVLDEEPVLLLADDLGLNSSYALLAGVSARTEEETWLELYDSLLENTE